MRTRRDRGFTLIEVLVVIMIMLIVLGAVIGVFGLMFRGAGLRQGGLMVTTAVNGAKMEASRSRQSHYVQFLRTPSNEGQMQVWKDLNPATLILDQAVDQKVGHPIDLPKGTAFGLLDGQNPASASRFPDWIKLAPTGYVRYPAGYTYFQTVAFEQKFNVSPPPAPDGDIIIHMIGRAYKLYMDIDEVQGSIRKSHFVDF
jgi:prepilin-type N-terminal cleavage/methylation domain-containing protein